MAENRKALWDPTHVTILVQVCVEEDRAGNRVQASFSKLGWKNIMARFNAKANKTYILKQIRNKWDGLKTDWNTWKQLKAETGIGWNRTTGTVEAPQEWWDAKKKQFPNYMKFRHAGLANETELDYLFASTAVTGETAWTPGAANFPPRNASGADGAHLEEGSGSSDDVDVLPTQNHSGRSSGKRKQSDFGTAGPSTRGKRRTGGGRAANMERNLERLVDVVQSYTSAQMTEQSRMSRQNEEPEEGGLIHCMDVLKSLPGVVPGDALYMLGTRLFRKPEMRSLFLYHPSDEVRLLWLREELELDLAWKKKHLK